MKTFNIDDRVMYMSKRIYKIASIEEKDFGTGIKKYYVLIDDKSEKDILYLPTDNELSLKNIRSLLTKEEIIDSINYSIKTEVSWITGYKERASLYNELLKENDMRRILCFVKLIMRKKSEFEENKKTLPSVDLNFLNTLLSVINEEFAYVLKIKEEEVLDYILSIANNNVLS